MMIRRVVSRFVLACIVAAWFVGVPWALSWYGNLGWVDNKGPMCWIHVEPPGDGGLEGRWRRAGADGGEWLPLGERLHRGEPRYLVVYPKAARDELIDVVIKAGDEEVFARGVMRSRGHYRLVDDALVPEPSLWGVPLYAWVPW